MSFAMAQPAAVCARIATRAPAASSTRCRPARSAAGHAPVGTSGAPGTCRGGCAARSAAGYALVETLVAAGIVVGLAAGVAQVAVLTGAAVRTGGAQGRALFLAVQKMEQLQSLAWTFDAALQPVSDESTSLALDPPAPGGRGLRASGPLAGPPAAGYVDYLDRDGRWLGTGAQPPPGTGFVRRWSVTPLTPPDGDPLLLQVAVVATGVRGPDAALDPRPNDPGVTWLATVRVRR